MRKITLTVLIAVFAFGAGLRLANGAVAPSVEAEKSRVAQIDAAIAAATN